MLNIKHAPKIVVLSDNTYLHFWYANNKGNGNCNCTIIRSKDINRASVSAKQEHIMFIVKTSHWSGKVTFSAHIQAELGLTDETIVQEC